MKPKTGPKSNFETKTPCLDSDKSSETSFGSLRAGSETYASIDSYAESRFRRLSIPDISFEEDEDYDHDGDDVSVRWLWW